MYGKSKDLKRNIKGMVLNLELKNGSLGFLMKQALPILLLVTFKTLSYDVIIFKNNILRPSSVPFRYISSKVSSYKNSLYSRISKLDIYCIYIASMY